MQEPKTVYVCTVGKRATLDLLLCKGFADLALTAVALARRRCLNVARLGELESARLVDGHAADRVAAESAAEALRLGLHHGGELRAARLGRRRLVAADVVHARVQADQRHRAPGLRRRRRHQNRHHRCGKEDASVLDIFTWIGDLLGKARGFFLGWMDAWRQMLLVCADQAVCLCSWRSNLFDFIGVGSVGEGGISWVCW